MTKPADGSEPLVWDWRRHDWTPRYSRDAAQAALALQEARRRGLRVKVRDPENPLSVCRCVLLALARSPLKGE